ncbi:MAG: ABC transporter permease subunit, partial [Eubacterium sp.]|nr:ABC transporter permease subunit [Eubacterium sp.]
MDTIFMMKNIPLYVEAAKLTVVIGIIGILLSLLVGLVIAFIQYFRIPILRQIASVYIELSRNTPLLVQLFFLYFGLPKAGISISAEGCAIL